MVSAPATSAQSPASSSRVLFLFVLVVLTWGTGWLPIRFQVNEVAPETTLLWRFACAGILLAGFALWRGAQLRYPRAMHMRFALMGFGLFGFNYYLMYNAAYSLPTGMMAVIFSTASLYGFALDALFFGRRVGPRAISGVVIGLAGLSLIFLPQLSATGLDGHAVRGLLLAVGATAVFSLGSSLSAATQRAGASVHGSTTWAIFYGCLIMAAIVLLNGGTFALPLKTTYLLALGWHVIVATVIAFTAYLALVGEAGMGRAAYTTVVFPVIALGLSTLVEGLEWTWFMALGVVLVGVGNVLVLRREPPVKRITPLS